MYNYEIIVTVSFLFFLKIRFTDGFSACYCLPDGRAAHILSLL